MQPGAGTSLPHAAAAAAAAPWTRLARKAWAVRQQHGTGRAIATCQPSCAVCKKPDATAGGGLAHAEHPRPGVRHGRWGWAPASFGESPGQSALGHEDTPSLP